MIPFRRTDERVWMAIDRLRYEQRDEQAYAVVMDRDTHGDLVVEVRPGMSHWTPIGPLGTLFGIPIEVDPTLRRGRIVLRHETRHEIEA